MSSLKFLVTFFEFETPCMLYSMFISVAPSAAGGGLAVAAAAPPARASVNPEAYLHDPVAFRQLVISDPALIDQLTRVLTSGASQLNCWNGDEVALGLPFYHEHL
jgi:hypothetical protein